MRKVILFIKKRFNAVVKAFIIRVEADGGTVEAIDCLNDNVSETASLQILPSAYNAGVCYAILPEDGTGDGTVDRDSEAYRTNEQSVLEAMPADVIRVDYADGGCPVILTEDESLNLYLNSEVLVTQNVTLTATDYVVSFYGLGTINFTGVFTGSLVGTGANERVQLTFLATAGTLTSTVSGSVLNSNCELGTKATSFIKTLGSTVARLKDDVTGFGDVNTFNSEEGVLYAEIAALVNGGSGRWISISDGTTNNRVSFSYEAVAGQVRVYIRNTGGIVFDHTENGINQAAFNTIAVKYKENDFAFYINGTEVDTELSGATFPANTLTSLQLNSGGGLSLFFGKTKAIKVYKSISSAQIDLPYIN